MTTELTDEQAMQSIEDIKHEPVTVGFLTPLWRKLIHAHNAAVTRRNEMVGALCQRLNALEARTAELESAPRLEYQGAH